jgi:cellulose synthase/poly-beta-1,6-N-acetylglucosamine synthase-like glycosyltransferase
VVIFDADNLIHPSFLAVMNRHFQKGYRVVQADFKPKNTDSVYARMDAIGDMVNFFLDREIRMRLNLSATIWGSGVAMDRTLYEAIDYKDALGGFDRKLQSHLVQQVDRIAFSPEAILFDEKISSGKSLENQRTRWISAYFKYFREGFDIFAHGVKKMDFNLIYFGFTMLRPPLFLTLGAAFVITAINYFIGAPYFYAWIGIMLSFVFSFIAIVAIKSKDIRFIKTIFALPAFVFRQVIALLKLGKAKKSFLKTQHSKLVFIDDLIKK